MTRYCDYRYKKIPIAIERSQRLSVAFLGLRGIIILLTPFPSNLGHFRGVLSDFKRALPKCLRTGAVIFFDGIKHRRKIVFALRRSYLRSTAFLGLGGIIILLTPFPSNLGHFRGVLSDFKRALPKCLRTGAVIFFDGIKHRRKIVFALRRSYLRSTAFLGLGGIIILLTPFPSNLGHFRGVLSESESITDMRRTKKCRLTLTGLMVLSEKNR